MKNIYKKKWLHVMKILKKKAGKIYLSSLHIYNVLELVH